MSKHIGFNTPYFSGKEFEYIKKAIDNRKLSGDGEFTKRCHEFFEKRYGFKKALLTTSCTDALELSALLLDIQPGDEIIAPSFTFVSTVNPFILRGAKIIFVDSTAASPAMDIDAIESLITNRTKAIIVVHYAGVACDMDKLDAIAAKHKLHIVEDAAQAIESFYKGKPLGCFGVAAAFSFHETKNLISGEGGMLAINDQQLIQRAEILREKGTNRSAFFRGEVDKYNWVDIGSSFLPSELNAAYLFAQLEQLENIQQRRKKIWNIYDENLKRLGENDLVQLPLIPDYATNNAHLYYMVTKNVDQRDALIAKLKEENINAVFHYQSLHNSPFYRDKHDGRELRQSERYSDCLVRLPLHMDITDGDALRVVNAVSDFYNA
jgi:dTDP-4-amino-4,6-dideoxygalactose transaminase